MNAAQAAPYVLLGLLGAFTFLVALVARLARHDDENKTREHD